MAKQIVDVTCKKPDGTTISTFQIQIDDVLVSQVIEIEYLSATDGGPLMRPKLPPGQ